MHSQNLPITGPCPIDLDAIGFDRSAREAHCAHCDKSVHNLSNMTRDEARAFLKANAGQKLCVSYRRGADGAIRFEPGCAPAAPQQVVPLSRVRSSARRAVLPTAAALGLAAALAACTPHGPDPAPHPTPTKVEQHEPKQPEPEQVLAGMMPIPEVVEPEEVVDGEMPIPENIEQIEGQVKVPSTAIADEPCDKTRQGT